MHNFLFEDHVNGGFFFVQCYTEQEAFEIVWEEIASDYGCCDRDNFCEYFDLIGCYADEDAEMMGYDTY